MKTLEKFSTFNKSLSEQELNFVQGGGSRIDYHYSVRHGNGAIAYFHLTNDDGSTIQGSTGLDSGGNRIHNVLSD